MESVDAEPTLVKAKALSKQGGQTLQEGLLMEMLSTECGDKVKLRKQVQKVLLDAKKQGTTFPAWLVARAELAVTMSL